MALDEIFSVEVVGGSSRIPAVKALIEQIFNKTVCTTLNQDEAVSRGAALQCAIMSPAVRVRDFSVTDIQNYAVNVSWDGESVKSDEMEIFPANHPAPFSRLLTLFRREPINIKIFYADPKTFPDPLIGNISMFCGNTIFVIDEFYYYFLIIGYWRVNDVKPTPTGESQEVKIKVRINNNGLVLVSSATMVEKKELTDVENAEVQQPDGPADGQMETEVSHNIEETN